MRNIINEAIGFTNGIGQYLALKTMYYKLSPRKRELEMRKLQRKLMEFAANGETTCREYRMAVASMHALKEVSQ